MTDIQKQLAEALEMWLSSDCMSPDDRTRRVIASHAALAAHRQQEAREPMDVEALIEDLSDWARYVTEDRAPQTLEKHIREVFAAHGIKGE